MEKVLLGVLLSAATALGCGEVGDRASGSAALSVTTGPGSASAPGSGSETGSETGSGSAKVSVTVNNCPVIGVTTAAPFAVTVGGDIALQATASDRDASDVLTFAWSATAGAGAGTFFDATAAVTSYTCSAAGDQTLTLTVSDGQCSDRLHIGVRCLQ